MVSQNDIIQSGNRIGIAAGGNWIIDHVKTIDGYPDRGLLANIRHERLGNGGAAYTVLKDLALLRPGWPLQAIGLIGDDSFGEYILNDCARHSIDTHQLRTTTAAPTSYTDVMIDQSARTFFHARGANALLTPEHFDVSTISARICHVGYHLLLDALDQLDSQYGTAMGRLMFRLSEAGIFTSLDVVSENSDRFRYILPKTLPYVDLLCINEVEAERTVGIPARNADKTPNIEAIATLAQSLMSYGVRRFVVIHMPEGALAYTDTDCIWAPSLPIPDNFIVGTVGAGDAFCAGALYGLHENWSLTDWLRFANALAAASLRSAPSSDGIQSIEETWQLARQYSASTRSIEISRVA